MKCYVVRHCTTDCSAKKIYCGRADVPLSKEGNAEAERLGGLWKDIPFDLVISSPLLRARKTAEAIAKSRNAPLLLDDRLKERDFGVFEGTDAEREDGKIFRYNFAMKYPNGESNLEVAARIYAFLNEIALKYAQKTVVLVSHGSACRLIRSYFVPMTDEEFYAYSQPNGSVERYEKV